MAAQRSGCPEFRKIGEGLYSTVYHRPGSRWVVQRFKPSADTALTPRKILDEYAYLVRVFASLPQLVPPQRLFAADLDAPISRTVLVKRFVDVDPTMRLTATATLPAPAREQMHTFLAVMRRLLLDTRADLGFGTAASLLPDIIDPPLENLAVDTNGELRLLDTNRLISMARLRRLEDAGLTVDLAEHRIHALLLRRMMFLESRFLDRSFTDLAADPLYVRYLTPAAFDGLVTASAAVGEPIHP